MKDDENPHKNHRARLRAQAAERPEILQDHRLIELLLFETTPRRDTVDAARTILEYGGSINGIFDTPVPPALAGNLTAQYLDVIGAVCRRYLRYALDEGEEFRDSAAAMLWFLSGQVLHHEPEISVMTLDKALHRHRYFGGRLTDLNAEAYAKEILRNAYADCSQYIFLAFRHPGGFLALSRAERELTSMVLDACDFKNMYLMDPVLLTEEGFTSLSKTGLYPPGTFLLPYNNDAEK